MIAQPVSVEVDDQTSVSLLRRTGSTTTQMVRAGLCR